MTDANFVYLIQDRDGKVERMTLLDGSWLNLPEAPKLYTEGKVEEFDFDCQGDSLEVRMRPVLPFTLALGGVASLLLNGQHVVFNRTKDGIAVHGGN